MPRELITVQVGQCGNQIGCRFWDLALREHATYNRKGLFDEAMSSFFRNVDTRNQPPGDIAVGDGQHPIHTLKARCILVDMEEGVINSMIRGPLGDIFDEQLLLTDVSGAGNNWAHGHCMYGPEYHEQLLEHLRVASESCDSLQSFLLLHSLGGGTGSGLGSYILDMLHDNFPGVWRFTTSVFPSEDDDVVTSPYNSLLSLARLAEAADCVVPVDNQALLDICRLLQQRCARQPSKPGSEVFGGSGKGQKPFDQMNGTAASMLLNLTASVRFEGSLNVDLNEISYNLVPYPRMHFLLSGMSPLVAPRDVGHLAAPRSIDQAFSEAFSDEQQLISVEARRGTYLGCGLLMRGSCTISDVNRNIARLRPSLRMPSWNSEGFKIGMCSTPPVGLPFSLLALSNNCRIWRTFSTMRQRFQKLYRRRFYLHHYLQYMDQDVFEQAAEVVDNLISSYGALDSLNAEADQPPALRARGVSFL